MKKGCLITFEGGEGGGKTSAIFETNSYLTGKGLSVVSLREPGGTEFGDQIREILFNPELGKLMGPRVELLLFNSTRAFLVRNRIKPAMDAGSVVLCDRFYDSTIVYQGIVGGLGLDETRRLCLFATDGLSPDLTLLFDIAPEIGLQRKRRQDGEWNRFEKEELPFHRALRAGYLQLASLESNRIKVIDASKGKDEVLVQVRRELDTFIEGRIELERESSITNLEKER